MRKVILPIIALSMVIISCNKAPQGEAAKVSAPQEAAAIDSSAAEYLVDNKASNLTFVGSKKVGDNHSGIIAIKEGKLAIENNLLVGGSFVIDMANLTITDEGMPEEKKAKLAGHLAGPDFFDAPKHPTATFQVTTVNPFMADTTNSSGTLDWATEGPTHTITGNLIMRDSTRGITFPAKIVVTNNKVTADAKFMIDRTLWGINYQSESSLGNKIINKEVKIGVHLEATK
jgi:polyisoprenoid-binding protein YceI